MEKFIEKLQTWLMPIANKISEMQFLGALGATFQILLPVILIGSFACLGAFLDIAAWQNFVGSTGLNMVFMKTQSLSLSIIALYVAIVLPYEYAKRLSDDINPISAAVVSFMAFLMVTPHELYTALPTTWFGYPGLFGAMIVTYLVVRFMKLLIDKKVYIKMPAGVPAFVEASFKSIVPAVLVAVIAMTVETLMEGTSYGSIHQVIYSLVQTPLQSLGLTLPAYLFVQILSTLFMFCGIHGNSIFSIITPLTMAASAQNLEAYAANSALPNIITSSFSVFCQPGGIGCTFALAFLLAFAAKSKRLKTLGRMSVVPAIFGINEPLIFGIPILLNPMLFIPYVLSPIVCTCTSYFSMALGIVPRPTGVEVNWTMPQFVSGFLAQGWQSVVLQIVNVLITAAIWYPFFKMVDKQITEEEAAAEAAAENN
ncbi:MAG: PTS transporter subunit EIIC [Erysipelotrichaceae bacterium]|nr:PTS transporter subunit EIIC [Erysipelotrichaceae bacterium]